MYCLLLLPDNVRRRVARRICSPVPFLILSVLGYLPSFAQERYPTVMVAEVAFARQEYARAAKLYEKILTFHRVPPDAQERLAFCYYRQNELSRAASLYDWITSHHPANGQAWMGYGDVLKSMGRYPEAKAAYRQVPDSLISQVKAKISGCDSALLWRASPSPYKVTNLEAVNTAASDWGAQWYGKGSIVFVSDRLPLGAKDATAYHKIYVTDSSGKVRGFAAEMNTYSFNDGPVSFSSRGDTAYFTITNPEALSQPEDSVHYTRGRRSITWGLRRLEIFWVVRDSGGHWGPAHSITANNTTQYSNGHAALTADGRLLYFTSDMPGGQGKTDIWYVERRDDGSWSAPVNCGPLLNTPDEDAFPTIGVDGRFYFASKGHPGMGGFDIFTADGDRSAWRSVRNLGYPINSAGNDFYLTTRDRYRGFLSSDRQGGKGSDDIYTYIWTPRKGGKLVLHTHVLDSATGRPVTGATVLISQPDKNRQYTTHAGDFTQPVEPGGRYIDSAYQPGYKGEAVTVNMETEPGTPQDTLNVRILLQKNPVIGDIFVLRNLYYDFDKADIRPDAARVLDGLVDYMTQFPGVTIELGSHTDARGSDAYNMTLSQKRAISARAYLLAHGIDPGRVSARGYGETRLVNGCGNGVPCPEAAHQANRRTEVRVVHP